MKKTYLTYALNHEGTLIHIDSVPNGNECDCICPACKKPLQAKNAGQIRKHHFAHQSGVDCPTAVETTLHLLAKEKIQKAFYSQNTFKIEFEYHSYCENVKTCNLVRYGNCESVERRKFNLKEYYDSCEQEIPYDNVNRRSDLKIWSKLHTEREPIYIEICVTHPSDIDKLHAGSKIIEIMIENEQDIDNVVKFGFTDEKQIDTYHNESMVTPKVSFYGFKNEDYCNFMLNKEIVFSRYILYQSGKFQCRQDTCLCKELKRVQPSALCEICFHTEDAIGIYVLAKWMGYQKYGIKNCLLCKNYVDNYNGMGKLCRLYKHIGINLAESHDTARARTCSYFILNEQELNGCFQRLSNGNIPITEL